MKHADSRREYYDTIGDIIAIVQKAREAAIAAGELPRRAHLKAITLGGRQIFYVQEQVEPRAVDPTKLCRNLIFGVQRSWMTALEMLYQAHGEQTEVDLPPAKHIDYFVNDHTRALLQKADALQGYASTGSPTPRENIRGGLGSGNWFTYLLITTPDAKLGRFDRIQAAGLLGKVDITSVHNMPSRLRIKADIDDGTAFTGPSVKLDQHQTDTTIRCPAGQGVRADGTVDLLGTRPRTNALQAYVQEAMREAELGLVRHGYSLDDVKFVEQH